MGLFKHFLIGSLLATIFIYSSVHIPEGIEDGHQFHILGVVSKVLSYVSSALFHLGVNNIFSGTRFLSSLLVKAIPIPDGVTVDEAYFNGVRVRVLRPTQQPPTPLPAFIYIHGGGLVVGGPEHNRHIHGHLVTNVGMVVISMSYRLSPEHLYPAQADDVLKATEYFLTHCTEWGVDPDRIFMGGESAGGFLTAVTTIRLIKNKLPTPRAIVLIYPHLQKVSYSTPSYVQNADNFFHPRTTSIKFGLLSSVGRSQDLIKAFQVNNFTSIRQRKEIADNFDLPELSNRGPPHMDQDGDPDLISRFPDLAGEMRSPLLTSVINQFPPTLLIACEFDTLRDDSVMMFRRLRQRNVSVEFHIAYSFHGMLSFAPQYKPGARALQRIVDFVNRWKR